MSGFRHGATLEEYLGTGGTTDGVMRAVPGEEHHPGLLLVEVFAGCDWDVSPALVTPEQAQRLAGYLLDWAAYQEGQANDK
jgi:hypothetical protein